MRILSFFCLSLLLLACSSDADSWLQEAKSRLQKGETVSAKEAIKKALEKNPGLAEAYNLQGVIAFQEKSWDEARTNYQKAIELKPSLYSAQMNLGALEMEQGIWAKALAPTEAAIKLQPDSSAAYLQHGIVQAALGNPDAAIADFTLSISKNAKEINALYNRGNIYFQQEKYALAKQDFEASVQIDPNFGKGFYAMGLSYYKVNEKEKACFALQQAQKLKYPGAKEAVTNLCN